MHKASIYRYLCFLQRHVGDKVSDGKITYKQQNNLLYRLLKTAKHTEFGKYYDFSILIQHPRANLYKAFAATVPIHSYESIYKQWWHRTYQGKPNVCWPEKIQYFALSSGTQNARSKCIPISKAMLYAIQEAGFKQFLSLLSLKRAKTLLLCDALVLGGSTQLRYIEHAYEGDISGIFSMHKPFWLKYNFNPKPHISKINDWHARLQAIVKEAPQWNIGAILGSPAWMHLLLDKIISHYNLSSIHDLWPNLSVFVHGGVSFAPYQNAFERLMAKPVSYLDTYLASEGFLAYQNQARNKALRLITNGALFYELMLFNSTNFYPNGQVKSNAKSLCLEDAQINKSYALIISSNAGAWRYVLEDIVRFTSLKPMELLIVGRTKAFLNVCGEHVSIENMDKAISQTLKHMGVICKEYTVLHQAKGAGFVHHWYIGIEGNVDKKYLQNTLDQTLKSVNADYATQRKNKLLDIQVNLLPTHVFYDWLHKKNKLGGQHKFPRILTNQDKDEWIRFINSQTYTHHLNSR